MTVTDADVASRRSRHGPLFALGLYTGVLLVLWAVSSLTVHHLGVVDEAEPVYRFAGDWLASGWVRWDGGWYVGIAELGYSYSPGIQSSVAFFPGYPLLLRAVGRAIDNYGWAAILVTVGSAMGAVTLYWEWVRARLTNGAAVTALLALLLFPYAWFLYGAAYGDALFLLTALGAFALVERDHPVLAGLVGIVATASRPVGIAVVAGLLVRALERRGALTVREPARAGTGGGDGPGPARRFADWAQVPTRLDLKRARPADAGVLLAIGGLAAWCFYLWNRFGDPFLFSTVEKYWGQPASPYTWFKITFFKGILRYPDRVYAYGTLAQGLLALAALAAVPWIGKRFGWGYGVYVFVLVAIPVLGSQDFQGLGRYLLAAFPVFAFYGEQLAARAGLRRVLLPCSAVALVIMTAAFAHGLYLA